ncbi:MAG: diguanylate cyclase [Chloroflexi bacterium]|nr:diguanylate cyclase [Chloroflexota bacterium]
MEYVDFSWVKEFPAAVTVCDVDGIILGMNDKSARTFAGDGGYGLIGSNLLDCHPSQSRNKLENLIASRRENTYTIEKNGDKKLIHQRPWFQDGEYAGFIEFSFEIPFEMRHVNNDGNND